MSVRDHAASTPRPAGDGRRVKPQTCSRAHAYPSPDQLGRLLSEHLVAEVIGLDSETVFAPHSLVMQDQKGRSPCHHSKCSHHNDNDVTGPQAWLCTCRFTCG